MGREYCKKMMAKVHKFFEINLYQCMINDSLPGPEHPLVDIRFGELQMLSLDENLITGWRTVFELVKRCEKLEFLSLIANRLSDPYKPGTFGQEFAAEYADIKPATSVKTLVLNDTKVTWSELTQ